MRTLEELIDTSDPAWPRVSEWFSQARNSVEVLPATRARGEQVLLALQVTTRSPLGALALETGGVFFDNGWLRFLGSGHPRMQGDLLSWNGWLVSRESEENDLPPTLPSALVGAYDAMGGFFAINSGAFNGEPGSIFYLAPDSLAWESLNLSYSQLLTWACDGNLAAFYDDMRWSGWESEVARLDGDRMISVYPPLWANPDTPISERSRRPVPASEMWGLQLDLMKQLRQEQDS